MSQGPSYEELAALVAVQARVIDELRAEVAGLRAENAELKRRLGEGLHQQQQASVVRSAGEEEPAVAAGAVEGPQAGWTAGAAGPLLGAGLGS